MHIKVVIESHSQMHSVIFHYFIAWLRSPLGWLCMFISSNHLDCECTHSAREEVHGKISIKEEDEARVSVSLHLTWKRL